MSILSIRLRCTPRASTARTCNNTITPHTTHQEVTQIQFSQIGTLGYTASAVASNRSPNCIPVRHQQAQSMVYGENQHHALSDQNGGRRAAALLTNPDKQQHEYTRSIQSAHSQAAHHQQTHQAQKPNRIYKNKRNWRSTPSAPEARRNTRTTTDSSDNTTGAHPCITRYHMTEQSGVHHLGAQWHKDGRCTHKW